MKRVVLIIAALIAIIPAIAVAQATPEARQQTLVESLEANGHAVSFWAVRVYSLEGASWTDPVWFRFTAIALPSSQDAISALDAAPAFFDSLDSTDGYRRVSAGQVDPPYVAGTAELENGFRGYLAVTSGRFLIVGETAGTVLIPTAEIAPYVLTIKIRLDASQPQTGRTLFRDYLPSLDEMPAGYAEVD